MQGSSEQNSASNEFRQQTLSGLLGQAGGLRSSDGEPKSTSGFLAPPYFALRRGSRIEMRWKLSP